MGRWGIDYAWHVAITDKEAKALVKFGVTFVGRYFSNNTDSKNITGAEEKALSKVGIDTVCFFESLANEAENGYAAGQKDARTSLRIAKSIGMPNDRPVYFAIDEDTTVGPHITAYFQGVASVIGLDRTGAYGGIRVISGLFDKHLVKWGFQTYAWSGGKWDARAQFRQYSNGHTVAGISCDYDTAVASDFGQWRIGHDPANKPPVKPPIPVLHHPTYPPPGDLCGPWPWGALAYIGTTSADVHCHSGVLAKDTKHVEAWQRQMVERGWQLPTHGIFNARCQQVAREFQKQKGITVTGRVNHLTWHHARWDPIIKKAAS